MSREGTTLSRLIGVGTIAAGVIAAYIMYRRGTPIFTIARKTITNPVGTLVTELRAQ